MGVGANTLTGRIVNAGANNNVGRNVKAGHRGDRVYYPWATAGASTTPAEHSVVIRVPEPQRS